MNIHVNYVKLQSKIKIVQELQHTAKAIPYFSKPEFILHIYTFTLLHLL